VRYGALRVYVRAGSEAPRVCGPRRLAGPCLARGKLTLSAEPGTPGHLAAAVRGICP